MLLYCYTMIVSQEMSTVIFKDLVTVHAKQSLQENVNTQPTFRPGYFCSLLYLPIRHNRFFSYVWYLRGILRCVCTKISAVFYSYPSISLGHLCFAYYFFIVSSCTIDSVYLALPCSNTYFLFLFSL